MASEFGKLITLEIRSAPLRLPEKVQTSPGLKTAVFNSLERFSGSYSFEMARDKLDNREPDSYKLPI